MVAPFHTAGSMVAVLLDVAAVPLVPREKFGLRRLDI